MTDPTLDLVTDHDVLAAYADLPGWHTVQASGAVPPVSVAAVDQTLAALAAEQDLDRSVDEDVVVPATRRRGRRVLLAAGLVAAITAGALVLPSLVRAPSASAEAASLLTHAADSIHATDPVAAPTQWWRIESHETSMSAFAQADSSGPPTSSWLVSSSRTQYAAVDGRRPTVFVDSPTRVVRRLAGPADAVPPEFGRAETWTTGLAPSAVPGSWQSPSPAWLAALPRDTSALRDRLYADSAGQGRSVDGEAVVYVADLLRSGVVRADLRAALYRVLATIPGVEITSSQASIGDVAGVGLGYVEAVDGTRQEIVVDASNGELIGERYVATTALDGIPAGTVIGTATWTRTLVDAVPASVRAAVVDQNCTASADGAVSCAPARK
jgi:RNA polymerase sigma-70 factor (ECF subfamily)